jgi:hypothetical protein
MGRKQQPTTIAILGAKTVVEKTLAQLLEGFCYYARLLKASSAGVVEERQLESVDLLLLSPDLTSSSCDAVIDSIRSTQQRTSENPPIPVIALFPLTKEPSLVGEAVRSVAWPVPLERLVEEIDTMLDR